MWDAITTRIPAGLLTFVHEAVYRGTTYACLLALTVLIGPLLQPEPCPAPSARSTARDR